MSNRSYLLVLLLLSLVLPMTMAKAQSQDATLKRFTVRDGLPFGNIRSITQDQQGFLWIGMFGGIYRHDGHSFTPYLHDPNDSHSLPDDEVWSLHVDQQGTLWAGTLQGLYRYDTATDAFIRLRHDPEDETSLSSDRVRVVYEDRGGTLWVGTWGGGLNKRDPETGAFTAYRHDPEDETSLGSDRVRVIFEDRDGTLWIGTPDDGGLNRYDPNTDTFRRYVHDAADEHSLANDNIYAIHQDTEGHLWVGVSQGWLHRMDLEQEGRFTRYPWSAGFGSITFIHESKDGTLWTGNTSCCLARYDASTDSFHDRGIPHTLTFAAMYTVHESRDGTLWFGTAEGLRRFDPAPQPIKQVAYVPPFERKTLVSSVLEDREGMLWAGGRTALLRYDRETDRSTWYLHDPQDPKSLPDYGIGNHTFALVEDHEGVLWVASGSVLSAMDRSTGTFTHYRHDPSDEASLMEGDIFGMEKDPNGNLWIATIESGLNRLNRRTGTFTRFNPLEDGIPEPLIQTLIIARGGTIWMGLGHGLLRFDQQTETFTLFLPKGGTDPRVGTDIHVMYEDNEGRLWYGAPHNKPGLSIFDPRTETFSFLPSEAKAIYGIQGDLQGRIWIHADDRLLMYDPETEVFTSFDDGNGLTRWSSLVGFGQSTYLSPAGELFFGVEGGVLSFNPETVLAPPVSSPPQVALTGLDVFSKPVRPSNEGPLQASIWQAEQVQLRHDQHTFSFSFAALDFRNPSANRHQYMLENYDATWREAGANRKAEYVQVPPGEYIFRVKAANSDGVWHEEGTSVAVVVLPPWWRTTGAYLLYGVLLIAGIVAADRFQRRRLLAKERERTMQREIKQKREIEKAHTDLQQAHSHLKTTQAQLIQSEKMASLGQLTAGIAHEIKNPLNFVNNFAEVNEELADELQEALANGEDIEDLLADLKQNAQVIAKHGKRADSIVKSMMEHAQGGEGERQPTQVNAFVEEYFNLAYHGMRAKQVDFNVTMEQDFDESVGSLEIVPQEIGRVLINLLNNAFYTVHERAQSINGSYTPTVTVSTAQQEGQIVIRVQDNGSGIPAAVREKIFEPFFTTKPTGQGNTGLGLSLSYDIVTQGHGGTLTLESVEGEGATFSIILPR